MEGDPPPLPPSGMPDGTAPRMLPLDRAVWLVVSDVPADRYASEALEPSLSDLDWVSTAGATHHAVVDALAEQGAVVLPFRLFTLFSTDETAVATLAGNLGPMARAFERVRGKQEWVLRIGAPDIARIEAQPRPAPGRPSGTGFLQGKAGARREAAARATRVKEDAAAAYEALEQLADAAKVRTVEPGGTLVLDAAFLLPPARIEAVRETLSRRAARLLQDGCPVSLTGPWPPYSFASIETTRG